MLGIYHPFLWNKTRSEVDNMTVYKVALLDVIFTGQVSSVELINANTGASIGPTISAQTWTVRGVTIQATRVTASLSANVFYYLVVDGLYSDMITGASCNKVIQSFNSCSNQYYDWDTDPFTQRIYLHDTQEVAPIIETESETVITETGQQDKTVRINKK